MRRIRSVGGSGVIFVVGANAELPPSSARFMPASVRLLVPFTAFAIAESSPINGAYLNKEGRGMSILPLRTIASHLTGDGFNMPNTASPAVLLDSFADNAVQRGLAPKPGHPLNTRAAMPGGG